MKTQLLIFLLLPALCLAQTKKSIVIEKNMDPRLIGTWASDCLTPNPEDDSWSEKHTFVFRPNNTATHNRIAFDKSSCAGSVINNLTDSYHYKTYGNVIEGIDPKKTEGGGLIDLIGGPSIYDIYVVMGNTLMLGHGFRNTQGYGGSAGRGVSATTRISSLNQYIVYKKLGGK